MRALLDTHVVVWALTDDSRLSPRARTLVENTEHDLLVSAVSAWEIAIKVSLNKLAVPEDLEQAVLSAGFILRPLGFPEAEALKTLPRIHADPFDRMLIAQAMTDGVPIITRDAQMAAYPIQTIW